MSIYTQLGRAENSPFNWLNLKEVLKVFCVSKAKNNVEIIPASNAFQLPVLAYCRPVGLLVCFSLSYNKPFSCTSVPSVPLFISLSSSLPLSLPPNIFFCLSPPTFFILPPSPNFAFISQVRQLQPRHLPPHPHPLHIRCPPSAFLSRALQRLYGPLSYQLHCGISRLSGLSSAELSVPPPPPHPHLNPLLLLTAERTTFVDLVFFFFFLPLTE